MSWLSWAGQGEGRPGSELSGLGLWLLGEGGQGVPGSWLGWAEGQEAGGGGVGWG